MRLLCIVKSIKQKNVMKKFILSFVTLSIIALILPTVICGKVKRRKISIFNPNVPESTVISQKEGTLEFTYDYSFSVDSAGTIDGAREADKMILQIAPDGISKFTSLTNLTVDSITLNTTPEQRVDAIAEGRLKQGDFMNVFKNYPAEGRLTVTDKVCNDWFSYEEELPTIDWVLTDSVKTILGYECKGARCTFRGREWNVYYSEDIPVMDGPWKLHGLPGLIMEAKADGDEYSLVCIGIRNNSPRPIAIYDVPYNKTSRLKFYDTKHRFDINPYAYFESTGAGTVTVNDENGNPLAGAYDPVELPYEYIERDWKE